MTDRCRILLVRHGQSTWNADGRWQGQADPPLSAIGEQQARSAAHHLPPVDVVVSSDLERARRTAELIAAASGLEVGATYPGLRERDVGEWTGLTRAEIERRWPQAFPGGLAQLDPPGGEPLPALLARTVATLHRIAAGWPGRDVLGVTHGGVVRNLERHLGEEPAKLPNLTGRWVEVDGARLALGDRVLLVDPDEAPVTTPQQL